MARFWPTLCLLLIACGGDDGDAAASDAAPADAALDGSSRDLGDSQTVPAADSTVPAADSTGDAGPAPDTGAGQDASPGVSQPNTGAICGGPHAPSCPSGETCLFLEKLTNDGGMCLSECDAPNKPCPVPDPSMYAVCQLVQTTASDTHLCVWFCFANGKEYACPNDTDYTCVARDETKPDIGTCVPKKAAQ